MPDSSPPNGMRFPTPPGHLRTTRATQMALDENSSPHRPHKRPRLALDGLEDASLRQNVLSESPISPRSLEERLAISESNAANASHRIGSAPRDGSQPSLLERIGRENVNGAYSQRPPQINGTTNQAISQAGLLPSWVHENQQPGSSHSSQPDAMERGSAMFSGSTQDGHNLLPLAQRLSSIALDHAARAADGPMAAETKASLSERIGQFLDESTLSAISDKMKEAGQQLLSLSQERRLSDPSLISRVQPSPTSPRNTSDSGKTPTSPAYGPLSPRWPDESSRTGRFGRYSRDEYERGPPLRGRGRGRGGPAYSPPSSRPRRHSPSYSRSPPRRRSPPLRRRSRSPPPVSAYLRYSPPPRRRTPPLPPRRSPPPPRRRPSPARAGVLDGGRSRRYSRSPVDTYRGRRRSPTPPPDRRLSQDTRRPSADNAGPRRYSRSPTDTYRARKPPEDDSRTWDRPADIRRPSLGGSPKTLPESGSNSPRGRSTSSTTPSPRPVHRLPVLRPTREEPTPPRLPKEFAIQKPMPAPPSQSPAPLPVDHHKPNEQALSFGIHKAVDDDHQIISKPEPNGLLPPIELRSDGEAKTPPRKASGDIIMQEPPLKALTSPLREMDVNGPTNAQPLRPETNEKAEEDVAPAHPEIVPWLPEVLSIHEGHDGPDIMEWQFEVDSVYVEKHGLARTMEDPSSLFRSASISLTLWCIAKHALKDVPKPWNSQEIAQAMQALASDWPPNGQLIVQINAQESLGRTWCSFQQSIPLNITQYVHQGSNTIRCIQLCSLEHVFVVHAAPAIQSMDDEDMSTVDHYLQEIISEPSAASSSIFLFSC